MQTDDLARAAMAGDQRAWTELYHSLRRRLGRYFDLRLPGAPEDHEDLIQSTLAAVYAKLDKFEDRGEGAFLRWVYGFAWIELQILLERRQREDKRRDALARERTPSRTGPSSHIDRQQRLAIVLRACEQFSDGQRRAIENQLAGGDAGTLAEQEQIERGSARMIQSRAHKKLRGLVHPQVDSGQPVKSPPPTPPPSTR